MPSFSPSLEETLQRSLKEALTRNHAYSTIEHLLLALLDDPDASKVMRACGVDLPQLKEAVTGYVNDELTELDVTRLRRKKNKTDEEKATLEEFKKTGPVPTSGFQRVVQRAILHVQSSGREEINGANVLVALFSERDSYAVFFLQQQDMSRLDAVTYISHGVGRGEILETSHEDDKQARLVINRVFRDDLRPLSDSVPAQPVLNTPRVADTRHDIAHGW